jgi:glycine cleavage system H protein
VEFPNDRQYHTEHLWAQEQPDGSFLIGITDFAQDQLGGIVFVDLPDVGARFKQGESCASIESVKAVSEAVMPVSGEVTAVNAALGDRPELLNADPYRNGWLVRVRRTAPTEGGCLAAGEYAAKVGKG